MLLQIGISGKGLLPVIHLPHPKVKEAREVAFIKGWEGPPSPLLSLSLSKSDEESSLLNPTNPYAATKASAEFVVRSYSHSFKLPIIITRGNNVYGKNQYPEKLIPRFILLLESKQKCTIHGEGTSKRNFIHVSDTARAIETILLHGKIGEIYNIGTNNEYSVKEIAKILVSKLKPNDKLEDWITFTKDRNFNDHRYNVRASKLTELGWSEQVKFDDGINQTIDWYLKHKDNYKI